MTMTALFVLFLVVAAVALFVTERLPIALVALIVMATLLLSGIITPDEGLAGFSNVATVTIAALFVLSAGLFKTGAVNFVGTFLAWLGKRSFWLALTALMLVAGALSAFVNHTAVVAIFIPVVIGIAREIKVTPSRLLMPLAFASMFGGVCTLIGSSTNILVSSIAERYGERPFGMFEFAQLGLVLFGAGFLYMLCIGIRITPDREPEDMRKGMVTGTYLTEIVVQPEAAFLGKMLLESPLVRDLDIESLEIHRAETRLHLPPAEVVLQAGDLLRVSCDVEQIGKLQKLKGIALKSDLKQEEVLEEKEGNLLVEAVIAPNSFLAGKSLKQMRFRSVFGATAHAIRHRGSTMRDNLDETTLFPGDVLLVEASPERLDYLRDRNAFVVVSEVERPVFRKSRMLVAVAIVGGVVAAAATGAVPLVVGSVVGGILLVLARCITLSEAYGAIDWEVILLLAGVLTLGKALEKTGGAQMVAHLLVATVGIMGPTALVSAFYLLTSVFTELMSNKATVALLDADRHCHGAFPEGRPPSLPHGGHLCRLAHIHDPRRASGQYPHLRPRQVPVHRFPAGGNAAEYSLLAAGDPADPAILAPVRREV